MALTAWDGTADWKAEADAKRARDAAEAEAAEEAAAREDNSSAWGGEFDIWAGDDSNAPGGG